MFCIILFQPKIPPNTGNIIRLTANIGCALHLIEPLSFSLNEKHLRRAHLDYQALSHVRRFASWDDWLTQQPNRRVLACTTHATRLYHTIGYQPNDALLFGSETSGLPPKLRDGLPHKHRLRIPMQAQSRSLNLSNSVAIVAFEAWKQLNFSGHSL